MKYKTKDLKTVSLTPEFADDIFPTRLKGSSEFLVAEVDGEPLCYLAMDTPPGAVTILHLHIPKEHRSLEKIMFIKEMFYEDLHPWCRDLGYTHIVVQCAGDDTKTIELFKTFDFEPTLICMAMMPVK